MSMKSILACVVLALLCSVNAFAQQSDREPQLAPNAPRDKPGSLTSDEVRRFEEAIQPYVEQARKTYPEAKQRYLKGLPQAHIFFVTTRLYDAARHFEQVFIAVKEIKDGQIRGLIASEIQTVAGYRRGDSYSFPESELYDWTISRPDGTEEGNFVGNFLDNYQPQATDETQQSSEPSAPQERSRDGAGQTMRAHATRFAIFDGEYLKQKGVNVKMNGTLAAIGEFGRALNVELFDVAAISGKVMIADGGSDLSDTIVKTLQSKSSGPTGLAVPNVKVPPATVAFVNTEAFGDSRTGVTRLVKAFDTIEQEFKPRRGELQKLREEAAAASGERKQKLEAEVARKQEAGQAALEKRLNALTGPIYQEIGNALVSFCKQNGISLVFDLSKLRKTDTLPPFDLPLPADAPDITEAFISAYNRGALKP